MEHGPQPSRRSAGGAQRAAEIGLVVDEALLRHDLVRLGEARAERGRLAELARQIGGELVASFASHTEALFSGSGRILNAVSLRFADLGANLVAAEAALDARDASRREGLQRRAAECAELARRLTEQCEGVRSPAQRSEPELAVLTGREREVATLAARGLTNQEIAQRLGLSRRTVENHLQHAFDKLAVARRSEPRRRAPALTSAPRRGEDPASSHGGRQHGGNVRLEFSPDHGHLP